MAGATLAISFLERQRSDTAFNDFYSQCLLESRDLTSEPVLPRYRRLPKRVDDGSQQYFEAIDKVKGEISSRFQQKRGMPVAAALESILLNAFVSDAIEIPEHNIVQLYSEDIEFDRL